MKTAFLPLVKHSGDPNRAPFGYEHGVQVDVDDDDEKWPWSVADRSMRPAIRWPDGRVEVVESVSVPALPPGGAAMRDRVRAALKSWHADTHVRVDAEGFVTNCAAWREMLACCLDEQHEDFGALVEHIARELDGASR